MPLSILRFLRYHQRDNRNAIPRTRKALRGWTLARLAESEDRCLGTFGHG